MRRCALRAARAAFIATLSAIGCSAPSPGADTGIRLSISLDPSLGIDRLWISGHDATGNEVFAPGQLPESPRTLAASETATLLLADALAGLPLSVRIDGLVGALVTATERATVTPVLGGIVELAITLGAPAVCGDGVLRQGFETCDDGNTGSDDGCDAACDREPGFSCLGEPSSCAIRCGDSLLGVGEECDDGGALGGDGCSTTCQIENGFACDDVLPSPCHPACGDGLIVPPEACDDGNTDNGDGCSGGCVLESGWTCNGATPSRCRRCGNGLVEVGEECDDAGIGTGDGCDDRCEGELGYICVGVPSVCTNTVGCGNGLVEASETCDDNNLLTDDGCSAACAIEPTWSCNTTVTPSVCARCGDGIVQPSEGCDDGGTATGDGCGGTCQVDNGWTCTNTVVGTGPSLCGDCGNGVREAGETCDDGDAFGGDGCAADCTIEATFTCDTSQEPTVCMGCGDGVAQPGQVCDGADLGDATCLSLGYRVGGGSTGAPTCAAGCLGFDVSGCGAAIDSPALIQAAIDDAFALPPNGPHVVAIQPGAYDLTQSLQIAGDDRGLVLRALGGTTLLRMTHLSEPAVRVTAANVVIEGLNFAARNAVVLDTGADGSTVVANYFQYPSVSYAPVVGVESRAADVQIIANAFHNQTASVGRNAIRLTGANRNTVAMNIIDGPWGGSSDTDGALGLENVSGGHTRLDHNSVRLVGTQANLVGIALNGVTSFCYRANILSGTSSSTGIRIDASSLGSGCPGGQAGNNVNVGHGTDCRKTGTGNPCGPVCGNGANSGPMCDVSTAPGFTDAWLCLPSGNGLRDAGQDLGYDADDATPESFAGSAPDLGARESGTSRTYGDSTSSCL